MKEGASRMLVGGVVPATPLWANCFWGRLLIKEISTLPSLQKHVQQITATVWCDDMNDLWQFLPQFSPHKCILRLFISHCLHLSKSEVVQTCLWASLWGFEEFQRDEDWCVSEWVSEWVLVSSEDPVSHSVQARSDKNAFVGPYAALSGQLRPHK